MMRCVYHCVCLLYLHNKLHHSLGQLDGCCVTPSKKEPREGKESIHPIHVMMDRVFSSLSRVCRCQRHHSQRHKRRIPSSRRYAAGFTGPWNVPGIQVTVTVQECTVACRVFIRGSELVKREIKL
jgi:hypothetical protein